MRYYVLREKSGIGSAFAVYNEKREVVFSVKSEAGKGILRYTISDTFNKNIAVISSSQFAFPYCLIRYDKKHIVITKTNKAKSSLSVYGTSATLFAQGVTGEFTLLDVDGSVIAEQQRHWCSSGECKQLDIKKESLLKLSLTVSICVCLFEGIGLSRKNAAAEI